jgi:hypothetical protein
MIKNSEWFQGPPVIGGFYRINEVVYRDNNLIHVVTIKV